MVNVFNYVFHLPLPCNGNHFYSFSKPYEIISHCSFKEAGKNSDLITNEIAQRTSFYYHAVEILMLGS